MLKNLLQKLDFIIAETFVTFVIGIKDTLNLYLKLNIAFAKIGF